MVFITMSRSTLAAFTHLKVKTLPKFMRSIGLAMEILPRLKIITLDACHFYNSCMMNTLINLIERISSDLI
jgi:hypothetical protein